MEYDPLEMARVASNYIDNAWEKDFPCVGDCVEIWNITDDTLDKAIEITGFHKIDHDETRVLVTFEDLGNDCLGSIELSPAQIIQGVYMIDNSCYSMRIIRATQI